MTKITKSVRSTIKDVVEKQGCTGSHAMRGISAATIVQHLRDEHGIKVDADSIIKMMDEIAAA